MIRILFGGVLGQQDLSYLFRNLDGDQSSFFISLFNDKGSYLTSGKTNQLT